MREEIVYQGKGNHSVNMLETIIEQLLEKNSQLQLKIQSLPPQSPSLVSEEEIEAMAVANHPDGMRGLGFIEGFKKCQELSVVKEGEKDEEDWISVKNPPELKPYYVVGIGMRQPISMDIIAWDGEDVFIDTYEHERGFHPSVIKYQLLPNPPKQEQHGK